jgi:hypothetical protein
LTVSERHDDGSVRALGPHLGVALYDPIVAENTRSMGAGDLPTLLTRAGFADFVRHDRLRIGGGRLELS